MRLTRALLALTLLSLPAVASAQTTYCQATAPGGAPTCNLSKNVQSTINNLLFLGVYSSGTHDLQANDSLAYQKTWRANNNTAGATGTAVAITDSLRNALAADSVIVLANRPYVLTIRGSTDIFTFDKDLNYNTCRTSAVATAGCTTTETLAGKPIGDLYWSKDGTTYSQVIGVSGSPAAIRTASTGERYAAPITFKSAWFYATDIPGSYTATVVYTVTGQ